MSTFNQVILLGNLTRDPEHREVGAGNAVCSFGVAVNERWKDKAGNDQESTCFVDISCWGRQAENCSKYLGKGSQVLVSGKLKLDTWESQNGEKRSKLQVVAQNVQFLSKPEGGGQTAKPAPVPAGPATSEEDDLPF